jgi:hypothetical protein
MSRQAALQSTANWVLWNLAAERVRAEVAKDAWLRLRYEDFVADPIGAVQRITRLVGRGGVATPFVDGRTAVLDGNHTVSGNPSRFSSGSVTIADDAQWLREQGAVERITSTAVALPLLRRYGYPLVPSDHRSM